MSPFDIALLAIGAVSLAFICGHALGKRDDSSAAYMQGQIKAWREIGELIQQQRATGENHIDGQRRAAREGRQ